jgi:hypothetical protein
MSGPPDKRIPPAGNGRNSEDQAGGRSTLSLSQPTPPRPELSAPEADATATPCRRCNHPLRAPRSVARGIGPVCMHLVAGEAR